MRWFKIIATVQTQIAQTEINRLRKDERYRDPKCLIPFGLKVYSQNDEDGIISEIFRRIGTSNRVFVEFGVGNGLENNTYYLLFQGWKGLWIDADSSLVEQIRARLPKTIACGSLTVTRSFVTTENINKLIKASIVDQQIDLLSVDIDGNDFHVLTAISVISPRVIVVEYNAKFPPPVRFCMDYEPRHVSKGDDCFGASLSFFTDELSKKGYALVACNLSGANAFFVRKDLLGDRFLAPGSAEFHYEPPRYYLAEIATGHRPSFDSLEKSYIARQAEGTS